MSVKISALPSVPSALLTDFFPMVQGGITYKETLSQVAALFNANLSFLPLSGGTMAGAISMGGFKIDNMADPTLAQDAATKAYVDAQVVGGPFLPLAGGTMSGAINMGSHQINAVTDPTLAQDAATKAYVDAATVNAITTIENAGVALTHRNTLNFSGSGITAVDNVPSTRTDVSLATNLVDIAALTPTANSFIYGNSAGTHFVNSALQFAQQRYIDFVNGDDTTNDGSMYFPWKTLQHAYNSVTPSFTQPFVFNLAVRRDNVDASPINGKSNVFLNGIAGIVQIDQDIVITGAAQDAVIVFNNINLLGTFTWTQNDAFTMAFYIFDTMMNFQTTFQQTGAGQSLSLLDAQNSLLTNTSITAGKATIVSTSIIGNFTYNDSGPAFFQAQGGDFGFGTFSFSGGITADFSGVFADSGYLITTATTGSGTPSITSDCSSIPLGITGPGTLTFTSQDEYINANYTPVNYTPTVATVDGNFRGIDAALASSGGFTWNDQTTTPVTLVTKNGYVADNAGLVTLNMPAVAAFGATFDIVGKGAGGWLLQMNAGQTINLGNIPSSVAGTIASTNQWDCISILCVTANTTFVVVNSVGQLSVN